jgi:hypothetical protein
MIPFQEDPLGADLFDTSRRVNNINDDTWKYKREEIKDSPFDKSTDKLHCTLNQKVILDCSKDRSIKHFKLT